MKLLKEIGLYILIAVVSVNFTVNILQNNYDNLIIGGLEAITNKLVETVEIFSSNIDKINGDLIIQNNFNRRGRQDLYNTIDKNKNFMKHNSNILNKQQKLIRQHQIDINLLNKITKPQKEPDFEKLMNGTVIIFNWNRSGAGVCIKEDENYYYILTANHIIENHSSRPRRDKDIAVPESNMGLAVKLNVIKDFLNREIKKPEPKIWTSITVETYNNISYAGELVNSDEIIDLALVRIKKQDNDSELKVLNIANTEPKIGNRVFVIGHPLDTFYNVTGGIVSNFMDIFIGVDASVTYGNSGGGVFNNNGELIGIVAEVPIYYFEQKEQSKNVTIPDIVK